MLSVSTIYNNYKSVYLVIRYIIVCNYAVYIYLSKRVEVGATNYKHNTGYNFWSVDVIFLNCHENSEGLNKVKVCFYRGGSLVYMDFLALIL